MVIEDKKGKRIWWPFWIDKDVAFEVLRVERLESEDDATVINYLLKLGVKAYVEQNRKKETQVRLEETRIP